MVRATDRNDIRPTKSSCSQTPRRRRGPTTKQEPSQGVLKTKLALEEQKHSESKDGDDGLPDFSRDWDASKMTAWEEAKAEFFLVWRVFKYVLVSWYHLPSKL